MARLAVSDDYVTRRNEIGSDRMRKRLDDALVSLWRFPRLGSKVVSRQVRRRYGKGVRKVTVAPYQIIYSYDAASDTVFVYNLLFTPAIRDT